MKNKAVNIMFFLFVALTMILSIWGPEALAGYKDRTIIGKPHIETVETAGEGYRYSLSSNEKLYILSQCLNSQAIPESEQSAVVREEAAASYEESEGTYAFVVNHKGGSGNEIPSEEIYDTCNVELDVLKKLGILPDIVREVEASAYDATLYSAIDVLEPRNNLAVWKLSLSNSQKNADKENRLIDIYIDADTGKIYEFYARTRLSWEQIAADEMVEKWSSYLELKQPKPYEAANPLMETTPYFKKYLFEGIGEGKTVVTIGFYEGINEVFLKISK